MTRFGIDLFWIPLGAGGSFVRASGMLYERVRAWSDHRAPRDLYHSALELHLPDGRYVVENAWPVPDERGAARGVVAQGPVFSHALGRLRPLRYEVRVWRYGTIFDRQWAIDGAQRVTGDVALARRVLRLAPSVPVRTWGRDEMGVGDMWNSNSVIAWLLARAGVPVEELHPPAGGSAPGWRAGLAAAAR